MVEHAEIFVQTVERVFGLDETSLAEECQKSTWKDDGKVSETAVEVTEIERKSARLEPIDLEEMRRQARENWLQLRQKKVSVAKGGAHPKAAERGAAEDQSHSIDDDVDD